MREADTGEWVVLMQHTNHELSGQLDSAALDLIFVEQVLLDAGIDAGFDPYRPGDIGFRGEWGYPVRLVVPRRDLERATKLARGALSDRVD